MDRTMAKARLLFICITCLSYNTSLLAQAVYSWQDEKGITHYSQQPPAKGQYQVITIRSNIPSSTPVKPTENSSNELDATLCLEAKEQLTLLNSEQELFTRDGADTELRLVTADEREQQKLLANLEIKRRCPATP
ncbi:hypothetical protein GCM10010919_18060 [Alishewanella longhuensis]|uniref:DUF4124 domain-containing protein n=2 Tax=Alishewanella longhuensis TaxID=1091037 RepID=A0ABQ3KYW3_9ALTE|nr:hypothetical protein GCM10010919_18060 [Alishewanella longhuensis]